MIDSLWHFFKRGMIGYGSRLYATSHPYLSGLTSAGLMTYAINENATIKIANLNSVFVTYNTVVFGFTATAIALAIAIPNAKFVAFLSSIGNERTPYRDFLFVLAWNGIVHIFAFFLQFPSIIFGEKWEISSSSSKSLNLFIFVQIWFQIYACFQFLVTTIGVYEMGDLYAKYVSKNPRDNDNRQP